MPLVSPHLVCSIFHSDSCTRSQGWMDGGRAGGRAGGREGGRAGGRAGGREADLRNTSGRDIASPNPLVSKRLIKAAGSSVALLHKHPQRPFQCRPFPAVAGQQGGLKHTQTSHTSMSTKGSRRSSAKGEEGEKKAKRHRNGKPRANMQRDPEPPRRPASCSRTLQLFHTPRSGKQNGRQDVLIR